MRAAPFTVILAGSLIVTAPALAASRPVAAAAHVAPAVAHACATRVPVGYATCYALKRTGVAQPNATTPLPSGYGPADLKSAYALPDGGAGTTVAVIAAYADPNIVADLAVYRATYKLPRLTTGQFRVLNQNGATGPLPAPDNGWAGEIALDVQTVSATCPRCNIALFEADSNSFADLATAVRTATAMGFTYISNSYGNAEFSGDSAYDSTYNKPGVVMTASTGDQSYGVQYPAAAGRVVAVGGTSLTRDSSYGRGWSETAWSGAGSGCSDFTARRPPQVGVATGCGKRAVADVSAVADPNTGLAVYNSYSDSGWTVYGGTSLAAPLIASVYALAGNPGADPVADLYETPNALNDVVGGSNGACAQTQLCTGGYGWDGPTGLGTPAGAAAFTPHPAPSCSGNALKNGGFESGDNGYWANSRQVITNGPAVPAHNGSWYAYLNGYGATSTDYVAQTVKLPAGCKVTVSYQYRIDTAELGTTPYDTLTVAVNGATKQTLSNVDGTTVWTKRSFGITPQAGNTVTLSFTGQEDSSTATSFYLDDVAITLTLAT